MARKRASPAKHHDVSTSRRLITPDPGSRYGDGSELVGFVRGVLLGAVVSGVVLFLFYPDISALVARLQPPEPPHPASRHDDAMRGGGSGMDKAQSGESRVQGSRERRQESRRTEPESAPEPETGQAPARAPKKRSSGDGAGVDRCGCGHPQCRHDPSQCTTRSGSAPQRSAAASRETPQREDLMEEEEEEEYEEEEEEEDSIEVELMEAEEEQVLVFSPDRDHVASEAGKEMTEEAEEEVTEEAEEEVTEEPEEEVTEEPEEEVTEKAEEDGTSEAEIELTPEADDINDVDATSKRARVAVENGRGDSNPDPVALEDGQTITFTPMSPGDDSVIRIGGRSKAAAGLEPSSHQKPSSANKRSPGASKGTAANPSQRNTSAKSKPPPASENETRAKEKAATGAQKNRAEKSKNEEKKKTTTGSEKAKSQKKKNKKAKQETDQQDENPDLPEEVRTFEPSFLKTVTAKKIFADGRRLPPVELLPQKDTNSSVKVFLFNEFLSEAECDGLRRVHDKHVQDMSAPPLLCFDSISTLRQHLRDVRPDVAVTPNDFDKGTKCLNATFSRQLGGWLAGNWSYSTAFYPGESRFSEVFASRVERAMGLDPKNGGKFQITSYPQGKAYKAHTDCVLQGADPRDRVATVMVYLDDVPEGGETKFPELGIWVKPRKGRALVWNNMSPAGLCEPHSLHVASKVQEGSKYILIRWYYYKSFYSLGKRPPEPPLPTRPEGTPRVSCDDYDHGSCRWYDEWNNDHLLEYELKKYTLI